MYENDYFASWRVRILLVLLVVMSILVVALFMTQEGAATNSKGMPPSPSAQPMGPTERPGVEIPEDVRELTLEENWVDTRRDTLEG